MSQPLAWAGIISLDADFVRGLPDPAARRLISAALVSAGGGARLPRFDSISEIVTSVKAGAAGPFTLTGARLTCARDTLLIGREAGDMIRQNILPLTLACAEAGIWDGRFEIRTPHGDVTIKAIQGHKSALSSSDLARYLQVPAGLRGALPALKSGGDAGNGLELLSESDNSMGVILRPWVLWRFYAALGLIKDETDLLWQSGESALYRFLRHLPERDDPLGM